MVILLCHSYLLRLRRVAAQERGAWRMWLRFAKQHQDARSNAACERWLKALDAWQQLRADLGRLDAAICIVRLPVHRLPVLRRCYISTMLQAQAT